MPRRQVPSKVTSPYARTNSSRTPPRFSDGVPRNETASIAMYRRLRQEIMWLQRKPGEPIVEKDIALTQGVSRTPVREALLRLVSERLVDTLPKLGTMGARIPLTKFPETILVRKAPAQAPDG